jgi:hypothetical protein
VPAVARDGEGNRLVLAVVVATASKVDVRVRVCWGGGR